MLKHPLDDKTRDGLIESKLLDLLGEHKKYDNNIDPLMSGPHMSQMHD